MPPPPTMHGTKSFHTELDASSRRVKKGAVVCLMFVTLSPKKKKKQLQKSYRGKFQQ